MGRRRRLRHKRQPRRDPPRNSNPQRLLTSMATMSGATHPPSLLPVRPLLLTRTLVMTWPTRTSIRPKQGMMFRPMLQAISRQTGSLLPQT